MGSTAKKAVLSSLLISASLLPHLAAAQSTASIALEEIVVTAQKRSENLQEVPIAISAFDTGALENRGIDNAWDLAAYVPTMQFTTFGTFVIIALRGVGLENTTSGGDPGVGFHMDGVYLARPVATILDAWDLDRMEVLRGPQGTLFGRNTTGGTINYIAKKPTDEFEASAELNYGNFDKIVGKGVINVPVNDQIAIRVTAAAEQRDGFQKNIFEEANSPGGSDNNDADDADNFSIRGQIAFNPSDNLRMLLAVNHSEVSGLGPQPEIRDPFPQNINVGFVCPPFGVLCGNNFPGEPAGLGQNFNGVPNPGEPHVVNKDTAGFTKVDFDMVSGTIEWDIGELTVKSVTAYAQSSFVDFFDADISPLPLFNALLEEDQEQWSQELQLTSASGGRLEWIAGLYFFNEDALRTSQLPNPDFNALGAALGRSNGFQVGGSVEATSLAGFGQFSYRIFDNLKFTGGFRLSYDEKDALITLFSAFPNPKIPTGAFLTGLRTGNGQLISPNPAACVALFPGGPVPGCPGLVDITDDPASRNWTKPSGRAAIDWQINDDIMAYASYSRGYKSGGMNLNAPSIEAVYNPEFVNAYEVGTKTQFFDRLQLNISAFYNDYKDLQQATFGNTGRIITNAAEATMKGIEADWLLLVTDTIELDGSFGYLDATYDKFDSFADPARTIPIDLSGNRINRAPKVTANVGLQDTFFLPDDMGSMTLRGDLHYQSSQHFDQLNAPRSLGQEYTTINMRLLYKSSNDRLTMEAYVNNLTDKNQVNNILLSFPAIAAQTAGLAQVTYNPPRTYGFRVGVSY